MTKMKNLEKKKRNEIVIRNNEFSFETNCIYCRIGSWRKGKKQSEAEQDALKINRNNHNNKYPHHFPPNQNTMY